MRLLLRFIEDLSIENREFNQKLGILDNEDLCFHTATICDEFHLLADRNFIEPIEWFYHYIKRIRKYKGRVLAITQQIQDLTGDKEILKQTTGIVNSCQFMFVFHMKPNDIENLDKLFASIGGLKSSEKTFLKGETQGDCIFMSGNKTRIKMHFWWFKSLQKSLISSDMRNYKFIESKPEIQKPPKVEQKVKTLGNTSPTKEKAVKTLRNDLKGT
jgi:hypothetical protein